MWIRSQNKKALLNVSSIHILKDGDMSLMCCVVAGCDYELGVYSTEEKALKVMDILQEEAWVEKKAYVYEMPQDDEVVMVKKRIDYAELCELEEKNQDDEVESDSTKLKPCPFCGGEARLQLTDYKGNFKDESYLEEPYSGIGYVIIHNGSMGIDCPVTTDRGDSIGMYIYRSEKAAIDTWNKRWKDDLESYVFEIMNVFIGSFINCNKELILIPKTNLYICLEDVYTVIQLKCKLLEWCSRSCVKGRPYINDDHNRKYQDDILNKINKCLNTHFTREQMLLIYIKLGNRINHNLTDEFVRSGYDMDRLGE